MFIVLLLLIFYMFISIGLPDSMIGAVWPQMRVEFLVELQNLSIITIVTTIGTVISSIFATNLVNKFGTSKVTLFSVIITSLSILGMAVSKNFVILCLFCLPLGLGNGSIHASINSFVAINCKASAMNFIHAFWGVGVTLAPLILSFAISLGKGWRLAYLIIAIIQWVLVLLLLFSLPLWKKFEKQSGSEKPKLLTIRKTLKVRGITIAMLCFFMYNGIEIVISSFANSYLVEYHSLNIEVASKILSFFFLGITVGRVLASLLAIKLSPQKLIRLSEGFMVFGGTLLFVANYEVFFMIALFVIGFGCGPMYANMLYLTPSRYGESASQSVIGLQMVASYIGLAIMNPLFGYIAKAFNLGTLPIFAIIGTVILIVINEFGMKYDRELV